ncbi:MAG: hypothetical protein JO339_22390 [Alphaproteobacteria bacterium]|nr:hypothetical protein [Alphaproteobacteria bacterium]
MQQIVEFVQQHLREAGSGKLTDVQLAEKASTLVAEVTTEIAAEASAESAMEAAAEAASEAAAEAAATSFGRR